MRKRTLRTLLKWSLPVNAALFVIALLDYLAWESAGMVAILAVYALLLVALLVILLIDAAPEYRRVRFQTPEPGPKTIIYGRR